MGTKRISALAPFALLLALPLSGLGQVNRQAPARSGNGWEQQTDIEVPAATGGRLMVRASDGAVIIRPTPGDKVSGAVILRVNTSDEAAARRLFDSLQLTARPEAGGGVFVSTESSEHRRHGLRLQVRLRLTVPQRYNLDIETQGGDISVESPLEGDARLTTAGGDVRTTDLTGDLKVETAGGNITLGRIGRELYARTAGGSIHLGDVKGNANLETSGGEIVTGTVAGALHAETAGGDVVIGGAGAQLVARTAGGQIQIGPSSGSVRAETAGGSIRLQGAHGRVDAETAGGSIDLLEIEGAVRATTAAGRILAEFNAGKWTFAPSVLETRMGDVYVYLPPNLPLTIDAAIDTAAGRKLRSDFPLAIQGDNGELVPSTLRGCGNLNGGGQTLKIRTTAGNIEIRKIDAASLQELQQREDNNWKNWQQHRDEKERRMQDREKARQRRQQEDGGEHVD